MFYVPDAGWTWALTADWWPVLLLQTHTQTRRSDPMTKRLTKDHWSFHTNTQREETINYNQAVVEAFVTTDLAVMLRGRTVLLLLVLWAYLCSHGDGLRALKRTTGGRRGAALTLTGQDANGVPLRRSKRGWMWNQFFLLEEYTGLDHQYVGKVRRDVNYLLCFLFLIFCHYCSHLIVWVRQDERWGLILLFWYWLIE